MDSNRSEDRGDDRPRRETIRAGFLYGFAALGLILTLALVVGLAVDVASIDRTSGGYDPPYTDYTGEPIDWDAETYTTQTGVVSTGHVIDVHTDCTTGMISFEVLGAVTVDYRELSDRAIAVHGPREACIERGFDPQF